MKAKWWPLNVTKIGFTVWRKEEYAKQAYCPGVKTTLKTKIEAQSVLQRIFYSFNATYKHTLIDAENGGWIVLKTAKRMGVAPAHGLSHRPRLLYLCRDGCRPKLCRSGVKWGIVRYRRVLYLYPSEMEHLSDNQRSAWEMAIACRRVLVASATASSLRSKS